MMNQKNCNNQKAFLALVRSGLWEKELSLMSYGKVDYEEVMRLAEEQSVVGLVTAGLEHVKDVKVPQETLLQFIGQCLQLEQENSAMNAFIERLIGRMRQRDIYALLVKGQGVAQCYERPLWRSCGDVDFLLNDINYEKAKKYLQPIAGSVGIEGVYKQHLGMTIDSWVVELHGTVRCGLSVRMDKCIDNIQNEVFCGGDVRSWLNGKAQVFIPGPKCDVFFVFTHFIKHFYRGGLGIRQVCDWCRLLWTYREKLNEQEIEKRLRKMGLLSEWKAFGAFAVEYLGMPKDAMPLYPTDEKSKRKAKKICSFVLEVGNFGHNRDCSYFDKYPYIIRKAFSSGRRLGDLLHHARIFPWDSIRFFPGILFHGLKDAARGE